MATQTNSSQPTKDLLLRAHSPDSADRIFSEKIQHRTLHLRPSSPPPSSLNARAARRKARQTIKNKQKQKPAPLSARQRRQLSLHDVPVKAQKYEVYEGLNKLWMGYINEILGADVYIGGSDTAAKLASAEFHGANVEVVRSRCPGRVGIAGIVVRDRKFVMEIITRKRGLKMVPKEGTTFRVSVDVEGKEGRHMVFEVLGEQMMMRSADRANRKFKAHFSFTL